VIAIVTACLFGGGANAQPPQQPTPGISIPGTVFDVVAPPFAAGVGTYYNEPPLQMPKPDFNPGDSLQQQLQDTANMFIPRDIVPSEHPTYADPFDNLVSHAAWIVNANNGGATSVPPITVTGAFTPALVYGWDTSFKCGATTWSTNYSCGRIAISAYKEWVTGDNDLLTLVGILAHEDGHNQRAVQLSKQGVSFSTHVAASADNAAEEEAWADVIAGKTIAQAIENGALPYQAACSLVIYLNNNSYDWDSIHKGPAERRERIIQGMSQKGLTLSGC
jgi:hypothetical protein